MVDRRQRQIGIRARPDVEPADLAHDGGGPGGVGTVGVAPLKSRGREGCVTTLFQPVAAGACTVLITTPEGFTTPAAMQSIPATVN